MSIKEIKDKYPKSIAKIATFLGENLVISTEAINIDKIVEAIITFNPRQLYEIFDEHHVIVLIDTDMTLWGYNILYEGGSGKSGVIYESRGKAEAAGIEAAFKVLEDKLNTEEVNNG